MSRDKVYEHNCFLPKNKKYLGKYVKHLTVGLLTQIPEESLTSSTRFLIDITMEEISNEDKLVRHIDKLYKTYDGLFNVIDENGSHLLSRENAIKHFRDNNYDVTIKIEEDKRPIQVLVTHFNELKE